VISSLNPFEGYWEYALDRAIHTTAMNPGFGGGGLIDIQGRLVGIVSLDLNEIGRFTMAIPVDTFLRHGQELMTHGRLVHRAPRAWVGLFCYTLKEHVVIAGVLPGTPGDLAGLRSGDVLLGVADQRVSSRRDLYTALWRHRPGDRIPVRVFRDNQVQVITVEAGDADQFFA
jgi:S1-C subfamily serine protease